MIIELEPGEWFCWDGEYPDCTENKDEATNFDTMEEAASALTQMCKIGEYPDASFEDDFI